MVRKKPAPDLIQGGNRFSEKIMLPKNRAYGCSLAAQFNSSFKPPPFLGAGFGIRVVLHAPRIRMMRGPAVAMPDLVLTDVGYQASILLVLREGDVADALIDP